MNIKATCLVLLPIILLACQNNKGNETNNESDPEPLSLTVNFEDEQQKIEGFGASDAWSVQFVGKNWPLEKREQMADYLFSTATDSEGHPEGIGLSIWRFNIGAGSARQGEGSGIGDPWQQAESFLTADSTYDWNQQEGQKWFVKAASERGVDN
jgi:O-glycosyl hydrolase